MKKKGDTAIENKEVKPDGLLAKPSRRIGYYISQRNDKNSDRKIKKEDRRDIVKQNS